ncbi:FKBP-type peptidyl-prolyl cis-trans isomerase [Candidatus Gracilibacteria bacterium]|nr:FKBP-type peptidyl-prolyl cis-trans isomerase [Candidatus Gracilibacteria bacterium]
MKYTMFITLITLFTLASCNIMNPTEQEDTLPEDTTMNTSDDMSFGEDTLDPNTDTMANSDLTGSVVLDTNHPLAGETLNFEVELIGLDKAEGNTAENTAEVGDTVQVHYVGTLEDGTEFDSSRPRNETLDFELGAAQMIPGFDAGVVGMTIGETKNLVLPPEEAYGERDENLTETVPKSELESFVNAGFKLEVGERIPTQFGELLIIDVIEE